MSSFAIYRLPHEDFCTLVSQEKGEPDEFFSIDELSNREGFVIAPFDISKDKPVLLFRIDSTKKIHLRDASDAIGEIEDKTNLFKNRDCNSERNRYTVDFDNFHSHIMSGDFNKIVLARCSSETSIDAIEPRLLFERACRLYPRMFVALVSSKRCGTWLTASPEILLEGGGRYWRTVALAGTMKLEKGQLNFDASADVKCIDIIKWNQKNIQEQRYVSTYITECLEHFSQNIAEEGPFTARAGDLVHLRSNFDFTLHSTDKLGELINMLYPTPAVCGLPKESARRFIIDYENADRKYYSGFMGPLHPEGKTHLYVSLRCMNIDGTHFDLYAGGGLLNDSDEESEWNETEAKLETMRKCLAIKRI